MLSSVALRLASTVSRAFLRLPPRVLARLVPHDRAVGLDLQARVALATFSRLGAKPPYRRTVAAARRDMELAASLLARPRTPDVVARDLLLKTAPHPLRARLYRPRGGPPTPLPALVFYHGGGFVLGSLDSHDASCRELVQLTRGAVVAVDYRLAPEHPFPAAPDDALAAFRAIAADAGALGLDADRLAVGGDSAGGTLATTVALDTRADARRPMFQLLIYPAVELSRSFPSITRLGQGYFLERTTLEWFAEHYLPTPAHALHPRASPWFRDDLTGAPPAFVATAAFDPLVDEGRAWVERLVAAGVPTEHEDHPTLFHGFAATTGGIQSAREAMARAAAALAAAWSGGSSARAPAQAPTSSS